MDMDDDSSNDLIGYFTTSVMEMRKAVDEAVGNIKISSCHGDRIHWVTVEPHCYHGNTLDGMDTREETHYCTLMVSGSLSLVIHVSIL